MSVRPKDLIEVKRPEALALHCGDCLVDYPAMPELYEWMFEGDLIVCAACGVELVAVEKVMVEN